ncbi:hypothetical protein V8C86DRAFT_2944014 [Haematococcus lacustris]
MLKLRHGQPGPARVCLQPTCAVGCPAAPASERLTRRGLPPTAVRSSPYTHPALFTNDDTFAEASYWDGRYKSHPGQSFEWYRGFSSLRPLLLRYLPPSQPCLQLGMGSSQLHVDMVQLAAYQSIVSVDFALASVTQQQEACQGMPQLQFKHADARCLPPEQFPDASFGGVLDKGTLDALMCGDTHDADTRLLLHEAVRVLRPAAWYLQITHAAPASRLRYLQQPELGWAAIEVWEVGQQGALHGPHAVDPEPQAPGQPADPIAAQLQYSHWVYACRKSG